MQLHPKVSPALVARVKLFERLTLKAVHLSDGRYMVGYGHTRGAREGLTVTQREAEALLYYDLSKAALEVEARCFTPLSRAQFEALTAFAFNIGNENFRASAVLALVNEGRLLEAAEAMEAWRQADVEGRRLVMDALVRRRAAEKALFLQPPDGFAPVPTPAHPVLLDGTHAFGGVAAIPSGEAAPSPEEEPRAAPEDEGRATPSARRDAGVEALGRRLAGGEARPPAALPFPHAAEAEPPPVERGPPPLPLALAPFGATGASGALERRDVRRGGRPRAAPRPTPRGIPPGLSLGAALLVLIAGLGAFGYGLIATLTGPAGLRGLLIGLLGLLLAVAGGYLLRRLASTDRDRRAT
jgi:lysozyme